jgi:hypothetical protein
VTSKSSRQSAKIKKSPYFVFYAVSLFIVTGWLGIVGVWEYSAHLIASQRQVATATVTGKAMHPAGEPGHTKTSYEEDFVFITAAGRQIEGKTNLTPDSWDRIKPGDTFQLAYAASEPSSYQFGTDTSTTLSDCVFLVVLVIWLVFLRLTIKALNRRPTPRARAVAASDSAAGAPRCRSINGVVLAGITLSVVGAVFLLIGTIVLVNERGFRIHGKPATATVLTKSTVIGKNGDNYPLGVRFTTDEGKSIETSVGVDLATMTSLQERLPVKIIYAPEHPEKIRLASDNQFSTFVFLGIFAALGGILAIAGVIMMSFGFLDAKRKPVPHAER